MAFSNIPTEILIEIGGRTKTDKDLSSFSRLNKRCHNLFDDCLYQNNIPHGDYSALIWIAMNGVVSAVRKMIDLGANVNTKTETATPSSYV